MFPAYPDGWPGLGLLLLRAAAGSVLLVQGIAALHGEHTARASVLAMAATMLLLGALLCLGLLTRSATAAAAIGTMGTIASWFPTPKTELFESRSTALFALVIAAAIAAVGPGAFSLDARLFGRREVIIPKNQNDRAV